MGSQPREENTLDCWKVNKKLVLIFMYLGKQMLVFLTIFGS